MLRNPSICKTLICQWVFVSALFTCNAIAAPSGGPYGPQPQTYQVPKNSTVIYVAPDGNKNAKGATLDEPTTLEAAFKRVSSGDAVILRGGVYRSGNLKLNQGITMQPYLDETPVIKGTKLATDWQKAGENLWRTTWRTLFPSKPMHWWRREREEKHTPMHRFNNDLVFFDGEFLQSVGSPKEVDEHSYFIDYDKQQVYIGRNPAGHAVEITAHDIAILRTSEDLPREGSAEPVRSDKKGPQIRGITFTQYAWTAFSIEGKRHFTHLDEPVDEPVGPADPASYGKEVVGMLLENVTITYCGRVAGYFRGDGLVIRNSLVSDTSTEGIYIIGSSDVLLERNIIQRNNIEHITGYYASAVKIINQTHDVVVRDNLVLDNPNSVGVWYDVGNRNGVFVNNYVEGADTGFFFEISRGVTVAGNVFVNSTPGVRILNSADAHIYNNTFVDSPAHIRRDQRSAQGDHFDWHPATGPGIKEREGHSFVNNLLVASTATDGPLLQVTQPSALCEELKNSPMTAMDGNVYIRPASHYHATATPLVEWMDERSSDCVARFDSPEELHAQFPVFAAHEQLLQGTPRNVFQAADLRQFQLARPISQNSAVSVPKEVRTFLGWSQQHDALSVGAYPVK